VYKNVSDDGLFLLFFEQTSQIDGGGGGGGGGGTAGAGVGAFGQLVPM
jgi:hypothetical protein